jgi:hypothetical protein
MRIPQDLVTSGSGARAETRRGRSGETTHPCLFVEVSQGLCRRSAGALGSVSSCISQGR